MNQNSALFILLSLFFCPSLVFPQTISSITPETGEGEYDYVINNLGKVSSVSDETIKKLENQLDEYYQVLLKEYGDLIQPEHSCNNPAVFDKTELSRIDELAKTHKRLVKDKKIVSPKVDDTTIYNLLFVLQNYYKAEFDDRTGRDRLVTDSNQTANEKKRKMKLFDDLMDSPYFPKNDYLRQNAFVKEAFEKQYARKEMANYQYRLANEARESVFEIDYDSSYAPRGELRFNSYEHDGYIYFKNISRSECYVRYNRYFPKDQSDSYNRSYPYRITGYRGLEFKTVAFRSYEEMLMEIERAYKAKFRH